MPVRAREHIEPDVDPSIAKLLQIRISQLAVGLVEDRVALGANQDCRIIRVLGGPVNRDFEVAAKLQWFSRRSLDDVPHPKAAQMVTELRRCEPADEQWCVGIEVPERFGIEMVFVLVRNEDVVDVLPDCLRCHAGVGEHMGVKPGPEVGAFGEPGIGENLPACRFDERARLSVVCNLHGILLSNAVIDTSEASGRTEHHSTRRWEWGRLPSG